MSNRTRICSVLTTLEEVPKDIILVVDDEPIVLRACSIAVARAGFRPVIAENGAAGLETFIQVKDEICLVLADIIMPAMGGIEMAESILQIDPQTNILLMSGYSTRHRYRAKSNPCWTNSSPSRDESDPPKAA